jgi:hypothetical protein
MSTSENKIEIVTLKYLLNLRVEAYRISAQGSPHFLLLDASE